MLVTTETKDKVDVLICDDCHITPSKLRLNRDSNLAVVAIIKKLGCGKVSAQ
jgi:tetraacyldisaccharide-1-P 4'-kinase